MKETRNIIDYYWYWKHEAIVADLDRKRNRFAVFCSNLYNDFNVASIVRNANAFLASMVYVYGRRKWDRRGSVGAHNYIHLKYLKEDFDIESLKEHYNFVAIDNIDGAEPIDNFVWPDNPLMFFGQEQVGLPKHIIKMCPNVVFIRQFGSVRSLNVACASAIAMYDFCVKNVKNR